MQRFYLSFSSHQTYSMGDMQEKHRHIKATKLHLHKLSSKCTKALFLLVNSTKLIIPKLGLNRMFLQNKFRERVASRWENVSEQIQLEKIFAPKKELREWDQKRRFFFSISKIKVMDERLASWLVLSLSKFPILSHHNFFYSWTFKDSYICHKFLFWHF